MARILLVSYLFPPANAIGAVRVGKLAKYLAGRGHELRVLTARDTPFPANLPLEVPAAAVTATRWVGTEWFVNLGGTVGRMLGRRNVAPAAVAPESEGPASAPPETSDGLKAALVSLARGAHDLVHGLLTIPDRQAGWLPFAAGAGRRLARRFRPHVVYASGPPFTGLVVARLVARATGAPLVLEYRDRWLEDPYREAPAWRRSLERRIEDWVARSAAAIVTVSEPWAADYRRRWGKPVTVVLNGYDPDDVPAELPEALGDPGVLTVVYTGVIYAGKRDPSPLFAALQRMGPLRERIEVRFYGTNEADVMPLAARFGAADRVRVFGRVPYKDSLRIQAQADVLLLMQWNDPREQGNCPAKLFEYLAMRRPVLCFGFPQGVPAAILKERNAGVLANDPDAVARWLMEKLAEKEAAGRVAALPASVTDGLSRNEQFARLDPVLEAAAGRR